MIKIERNTLKFGSANFKFMKRALITTAAPLDLTDATSITKFEIGGTQPENTERRIIFEIDGELFRYVNGILDKYPYHGELEDILTYGNTVGELLELENISAFIGKKIFPIIALSAPSNSDVFPKIKIALKWQTYNDLYTVYKFSPIFELLGDKPRIISVRKLATTTGNATELTECRLRKITGEWSDWQNYILAENQIATAVQFRTKFVVSTLDGTDNAEINSVSVNYVEDADKSAADSQTFFSTLQTYDSDLHTCYLLIKHSKLENAQIKAYVSLTPPKARAENVLLGVTDGNLQVFALPNEFVAQDSLHVELDGVPTFNFQLDTAANTITIQDDAGKVVSVSYDYFSKSNWQEMTQDFSADDKSRFSFRALENNLREGVVKFSVTKDQNYAPEILGYIAGFSV